MAREFQTVNASATPLQAPGLWRRMACWLYEGMLLFGVVGYVFNKLSYPLAPLVLALVLGDKAEDSFRQAMLVSQGELGIMFSNPLVGSITGLALIMLFWPFISRVLAQLKPGKKE